MYTNFIGDYLIPKSNAHLTAEDLTASAGVYGGFICVKRCRVTRVKFVVTTVIAASTQTPVVEFNRRPTIGSSSGEVLIDNITIPTGTAAGTVMYATPSTQVTLEVGDELSYEHTVQATDGSSATGAGYYAVEVEDYPEYKGNESNYTLSA